MRNANAGVGNPYHDISVPGKRLQGDLATLGHCVRGIDEQVRKHLLQLAVEAPDRRNLSEGTVQTAFPDFRLDQLHDVPERRVHVDGDRPRLVLVAEAEERMDDLLDPARPQLRILDQAVQIPDREFQVFRSEKVRRFLKDLRLHLTRGLEGSHDPAESLCRLPHLPDVVREDFQVAFDEADRVCDFVSNPRGQPPERNELLALEHLPEECLVLQSAPHRQPEIVPVPRFGDELVDPRVVDGLDRHVQIAVAGGYQPYGIRTDLFRPGEERDAVHPGHDVIGQDQLG